MSLLTKPVYDALVSDPELGVLLSRWGGDRIAVFTGIVPETARLPYVVSTGEVSYEPADTKTNLGIIVERDVRVFSRADGDTGAIDTISARIRKILHQRLFAIDGYEPARADVSGPVALDDEGIYGRVLTMRLVLHEENV